MGLFIGASVITLVELLDVLVHGFCKFYCRSFRKKKGNDAKSWKIDGAS